MERNDPKRNTPRFQETGNSLDTNQTSHIQAQLARRLLLVFLVPLIIILALGGYAYHLSERLAQLEIGAKISSIERQWGKTKNINLAIKEYEELIKHSPSPEILSRLAGFYEKRSKIHAQYKDRDITRAIAMLEQANDLETSMTGRESWLANRTLAYIRLDLGQEYWSEAIRAGEKAIAENPLDSESMNNLAWMYATADDLTLRDLDKAKTYATKAVQLTNWSDLGAIDTLVEVYLAKGEKRSAISILEKIEGIPQGNGQVSLQDLQDRLVSIKKKERV